MMTTRRILIAAGLGVIGLILLPHWRAGPGPEENQKPGAIGLQPDASEIADLATSGSSQQRFDRNATTSGLYRDARTNELYRVIEFPDGEALRIPLKRPEKPLRKFPKQLLAEYETLRQDAESGDAGAAYVLGGSLRACGNAAPSQDALDSAIDQIYQTYQYDDFGQDGQVQIDPDQDLEQVESSLRDTFASCQSVTDSQIGEASSWINLAAERGDQRAMSDLMTFEAGTAKGFNATNALWRSGGETALFWLAKYYYGRYGNDFVEPDPVAAYAYQFLWVQMIRVPESNANQSFLSYQRQILDELSRMGSALSPLQLAEAQQLAKQILRENENCCVVW